MKNSNSYLPFRDCHIVEIDGISPGQLKLSAKKIKKDKERIGHNTILNFIARSFGFKEGISTYSKIYETEIFPFLRKNNLKKHVDLCSPRKLGMGYFPKISKQKISERIFYSGLSLPKKIFTGYDFDYENTISDGYWYFNNHIFNEGAFSKLIQPGHSLESIIEANTSLAAITHNLEIAKIHGDEILKGNFGYSDRSLADFVLGGYSQDIKNGFNLIGDDLVQPRDSSSVIQQYSNDMESENFKESLEANRLVMEAFRQRIESQGQGWIDVIPFNEKLVFLRGPDGQFDFVFAGLKDYEFQHTFMAGQLKIVEVPYFVSDYYFKRWQYFEYKGWQDKDEHESECHYYRNGGESRSYPGSDKILISYYKYLNCFDERVRQYNKCAVGFTKDNVLNNEICISQLISISDFEVFLIENEDYVSSRVGDDLLTVNCDLNKDLPAACTWFDALAYCSWYAKKYELPVRLLTSDEYVDIRKELMGFTPEERIHQDLIYTNPATSVEYKTHPPYMAETDFQSLRLTYRENISKVVLENGLGFLNSNDFSEWLLDKTCIRSASLTSFYRHGDVVRSSPPLDSTGKYKHQKIGFRICYDIS
jgi:hypothetical protein